MRLSPLAFAFSVSKSKTPTLAGNENNKAALMNSIPGWFPRARANHLQMREQTTSSTALHLGEQDDEGVVFIDPDFLEDVNGASEEKSVKPKPETKKPEDLPPRHPRAWSYTQSILTVLDLGEQFAPGMMDRFFDGLTSILQDNTKESSFIAKGLTELIGIIRDCSDDNIDARREYLYLLLVSSEVFNEACQQRVDEEGNELPNDQQVSPLLQSILFGQLDNFATDPTKFDPLGIFQFYDSLLNTVVGDRKKIAYDAISGIKDRLLNIIKDEDPSSLTAKVTTALYLLISVDTGQDISTEEISDGLQDLGIPAIKLSQTIADLLKTIATKFFGEEAAKKDVQLNQVIAACEKLQEFCRPMSEEQAEAQITKAFGKDWRDKLGVDFDFSKSFRCASISCTYVGVKRSTGAKVFLKLQRPNLENQLKKDRIQSQQLLRAFYRLLEEASYAEIRAGKILNPLLSQASLFEKSEKATNEFFELFDYERDFVQEALALKASPCLTPKVFAYANEAILMEFIDHALNPKAYQEISSEKSQETDYRKAANPKKAAEQWLQKHCPIALKTEGGLEYFEEAGKAKASFEDGATEDLWLDISGKSQAWRIKPMSPFIDYSLKARRKMAMQFLIDLAKQVANGDLNADAHKGNFLIGPTQKVGDNNLFSFDLGLRAKITQEEEKIVGNFFAGLSLAILGDLLGRQKFIPSTLTNPLLNEGLNKIANAYLGMSKKGQEALKEPKSVNQFVKVLKDAKYARQILTNPNGAMEPVMTWLSENDKTPDGDYYRFIRAFAGVASNSASMLGKDGVSFDSIGYLAQSLLKIFVDTQMSPGAAKTMEQALHLAERHDVN